MSSPTLRDLLQAAPVTIAETAPITEALALMERHRISCVLAVAPDKRLSGIFTEQDAVRLLAEHRALDTLTMARVMNRPVFSVAADLDYRDAYCQMAERGFRHLAVVDAAGGLLGVVTESDFLHHLGPEYLIELKTVGSAMLAHPATLPAQASLAAAAALMAEHRLSCVVIVAEHRPIGMVTERDLVRLAQRNLDPDATPLASVMHTPLATTSADCPIQEAIQQMSGAGIRRLVVVDEDGQLAGLISRHDIVKSIHGRYIEFLHATVDRQRLELEQMKNRVHAVNERLRGYSLMEQVSDALFIADAATGELVEVNTQACRSLDFQREELLSKSLIHLISGTRYVLWGDLVQTVLSQGQVAMEASQQRRDGSFLPVQINLRLVQVAERSYVVAVVTDLSVVRSQEAQIQLQIHALNAASHAIVITSCQQRILWANAAFSTLTGYTLAEVIGHKPSELVKSGKHNRSFYKRMWSTILSGQVWRGELINRRKDGSLYNEELTITPVCMGNREITHFIAIKQDISARKAAETALMESEERFRLLYERSPVPYQSLNKLGQIVEVNDAWLNQFGYSRAAVIGRYLLEFLAPGQDEFQQKNFAQFLADGYLHGIEYEFLSSRGEHIFVEVEGRIGYDREGRFKQTHCVLHNITERKAIEQRLAHLAATDTLTGLANRRHFFEQMTMALARYQRHDAPTALLMIDLDWFKNVNDRYGHAIGDDVLRHVANVMRTSIRCIDLLGRLGGEEFAILLPDTDAAGAQDFADRMRREIIAQPAITASGAISVTLSIGVAAFSPKDSHIDAVLARADRALYRAKARGRDRVEFEPG